MTIPACEGSVPDFPSESVVSPLDGFRVLENFLANDYKYIAFEVVDGISRCALKLMAKVNIGRFVEVLGTGRPALEYIMGDGGLSTDTVLNSVDKPSLRDFHTQEAPNHDNHYAEALGC